MSAEKSELRAAAIHEVGARLDDVLEGSNQAALRAEGAEQALTGAAEVVRQLHTHIDRELDEHSMDLEQATLAKRWVTRAIHALEQLNANAQQARVAQRGHAQGIQLAVQILHAHHTHELQTAEQHRQREAGTVEDDRPIKEQRLAEERASAPPSASESLAPPEPSNGKSMRPRRRRKAAEPDGADA